MAPKTINKAVRLVILRELDDLNLLDGMSYQQIANLFDDPTLHRSTILRDIAQLSNLRKEIGAVYKKFISKKEKII